LNKFTNKRKKEVFDITGNMNILITGASRGIGRDTAIFLSRDRNNQILITGRNEKALKQVSEKAENDNIYYYVLDFNNLESGASLFYEHCSSLFSIIDVVINNAGLLVKKDFMNLSTGELKAMM